MFESRRVTFKGHSSVPFAVTILIRRALESPYPGTFNGGSNLQIRHFGADIAASEVAGFPQNLDILNITAFWWHVSMSILWKLENFKSRNVGPKVSENKV